MRGRPPRGGREVISTSNRLYWDSGKENGNYRDCRGYIGIIGYILGYIGIMEKKMETTGIVGVI